MRTQTADTPTSEGGRCKTETNVDGLCSNGLRPKLWEDTCGAEEAPVLRNEWWNCLQAGNEEPLKYHGRLHVSSRSPAGAVYIAHPKTECRLPQVRNTSRPRPHRHHTAPPHPSTTHVTTWSTGCTQAVLRPLSQQSGLRGLRGSARIRAFCQEDAGKMQRAWKVF